MSLKTPILEKGQPHFAKASHMQPYNKKMKMLPSWPSQNEINYENSLSLWVLMTCPLRFSYGFVVSVLGNIDKNS
jgi:hypothetical protein